MIEVLSAMVVPIAALAVIAAHEMHEMDRYREIIVPRAQAFGFEEIRAWMRLACEKVRGRYCIK